jgi:hypothetical protein
VNWRVLGAGAALALLAGVFVTNAASKMPDFEVYWRAGTRALAAEPLYRTEDEHFQLKYLPAFAILAIPAALLPLTVAKAIWFLLSAALIAVLLGLSLALLPTRHRPAWMLIVTTLVAMAKFYGHELVLGQVNLLFATVVVVAAQCAWPGHGRPGIARSPSLDAGYGGATSAGLLLALAIVIKPYAVIFVPWLAAQKAGRALTAALAGTVAALLLPVPVYGLAGTASLHRDWWRTVTESTAPNLLNADNVSLAGMYAKWLGPNALTTWLVLGTSVLLLAAAAVVFALRRRIAEPVGLELALLLTLIPLLSPQGWDYVFLLSTPAVMYLVNYDRLLPMAVRLSSWGALAIIAFSLYDVMGRRAYAAFMAMSAITVCYLVVVVALVTLRLRRAA